MVVAALTETAAGESPPELVLYNGIELPSIWPPRQGKLTRDPMTVPYLQAPPKVIPIDIGRQLFVDDFLIEQTDLERTFHQPTHHRGNPVLTTDKPWELEADIPGAGPFSDGVFFDPAERLFKMWYMAPLLRGTCYATSLDGIHWQKPALDVVPGSNVVLSPPPGWSGRFRDSCTIWLDSAATDPARRYLMFSMIQMSGSGWHMCLSGSRDGIHWSERMAVSERPLGDRTTVFYNPFRRKWIFSVRVGDPDVGRARAYLEHDDPVAAVKQLPRGTVPWTCADRLDPRHPNPEFDAIAPQLYNLDATPYESVVLGLFSIWQGPPNEVCAQRRIQKRNEILLGFSRDGFHWHRPDRRRFIGVNETEGAWNWGNVQSVGGGCLVVGDRLYFYFSGRSRSDKFWDASIRTGLAVLRRDGFASMGTKRKGTLTTRPLRFGGRHLWVNTDAAGGEVRVEVLDSNGRVIQPFTLEDCLSIERDATQAKVAWRGGDDLSAVAGQPVRFRFHATCAELYAFWVSGDSAGASRGYVAGGGPGFTGPIDTVGATVLPSPR